MSLELIKREEHLAFFDPSKKTHLNRANKILPHVISWSRQDELELYSQAIDKIFSKHELGQQLKSALLFVTNDSYSNRGKSFCKKYRINKKNLVEILKKVISTNEQEPAICSPVFEDQDDEVQHWSVKYYRELYKKELAGEKPFEYVEKSYRKWHPLQNVRRDHKDSVFNGYLMYDYDISTALISVMLGDIQKLDKSFNPNNYHLVVEYRDNKAQIREKVGQLLKIDSDRVKKLFSYINNNGVISASPFMSLIDIVGSVENVEKIRSNKFFSLYVRQIKSLWRSWIYFNNSKVWWESDTERPLVSNKERFKIYFYNERKLLDEIESYLQKKSAIFFLEHDGFRSNLPIEQEELERLIKEKIQIEIKIEEKS